MPIESRKNLLTANFKQKGQAISPYNPSGVLIASVVNKSSAN